MNKQEMFDAFKAFYKHAYDVGLTAEGLEETEETLRIDGLTLSYMKEETKRWEKTFVSSNPFIWVELRNEKVGLTAIYVFFELQQQLYMFEAPRIHLSGERKQIYCELQEVDVRDDMVFTPVNSFWLTERVRQEMIKIVEEICSFLTDLPKLRLWFVTGQKELHLGRIHAQIL